VTVRRLTFRYVSGEGIDSSERGRTAWARIKGGRRRTRCRAFRSRRRSCSDQATSGRSKASGRRRGGTRFSTR